MKEFVAVENARMPSCVRHVNLVDISWQHKQTSQCFVANEKKLSFNYNFALFYTGR